MALTHSLRPQTWLTWLGKIRAKVSEPSQYQSAKPNLGSNIKCMAQNVDCILGPGVSPPGSLGTSTASRCRLFNKGRCQKGAGCRAAPRRRAGLGCSGVGLVGWLRNPHFAPPRNTRKDSIPPYIPTNNGCPPPGFEALRDFVHPQYCLACWFGTGLGGVGMFWRWEFSAGDIFWPQFNEAWTMLLAGWFAVWGRVPAGALFFNGWLVSFPVERPFLRVNIW